MEYIINLLWQWRFVIVLIIAIGVYATFEWSNFKSICYGLMLQAKRYAKDEVLKSGDEQVEWIVNKAYQFLPIRLTIFISKDLMRKIVQYLYSKLKDYLDDGQV
ncbi:hypothetical protein CSC2_17510 [Clostridium zeae]|uniref:Phage protein n=1 Tax=Clostridium zeae TaxID=2759022 RepID=A0ABQ1E8X6_9CLOT|nr:hypothetical protein [Clostridium zeae]GFZ31225.1 hypothetical protein CSC2_17510 [Clostridium zeae]